MSQRCEYCKTSVREGMAWKMHLCGKAHQQVVIRAEFDKDAIQRSVYARGFSFDVADIAIFDYFSKFGSIINIIFHSKQGRYCFVEFSDVQVAEKVAASRHYLNRRCLFVSRRKIIGVSRGDDDGNVSLKSEDVLKKVTELSTLQEQMDALVKELTLSVKEIEERSNLANIICSCFIRQFPQCVVALFGSSANSLGFHGCDLDVFVDLGVDGLTGNNAKPDEVEELCQKDKVALAAKLFRNNKHFARILKISNARIPIVRFRYRPYLLSCDVSFRNPISVHNTKLIYYYTCVDPRVRQMMVTLRYWATQQDITGQTSKTKLNNYALTMLIIFGLQSLDPPVLFTVDELQQLHLVQGKERRIVDGWDCTYCEDVEVFANATKNTMSLQRLLQEFFEFYSKFDFNNLVICPFLGKPVSKADFKDANLLPENLKYYKENLASGHCEKFQAETAMCLQDPFELAFNLTRITDIFGLQLFKRRCSMAAEICKSSPESEILTKLFTSVVDDNTTASNNTLSFSSLRSFTVPLEDSFGVEPAMKVIKNILETGLKFECQETHHDDKGEGTPAKKAKDQVRYLHCKGFWHTWSLRKQTAKEFSFPAGMKTLEKEKNVSECIIERIFKNERPAEPMLEFLCEVTGVENQIKLTLSDISSQKKYFGAAFMFLHKFVPLLVKKGLQEGDI